MIPAMLLVGGPLLLLLLLLFEQFIETDLLFGSQDGAEIVFCFAQFFVDLFASALLAIFEDFMDLFLLVRRKVQLTLDSAQKIEPHSTRGDWSLSGVGRWGGCPGRG